MLAKYGGGMSRKLASSTTFEHAQGDLWTWRTRAGQSVLSDRCDTHQGLKVRRIREVCCCSAQTTPTFLLRRARRLFPALFVVLLCALAFAWFTLHADEMAQFSSHLFGAAFYVLNFFLISESGYFEIGEKFRPLLHLWSLAIEE
jgi:hypothetical protein